MKKLDNFPLYPEKLLSSVDLSSMEPCEFGMYCRILFASFIQDEPCYIRNDEKLLIKVTGATEQQWNDYKHNVLKEFKQKNGYLYNPVLLKIYEVQVKDKKKKSRKNQLALTMELNYTFAQFWNDYDKKTGDQKRLIPKWLNLTDEERELIRAYIPKYKEAQPDKFYRKNPESFLNQRGWEHEIIKRTNTNTQFKKPDLGKDGNQGTSTI